MKDVVFRRVLYGQYNIEYNTDNLYKSDFSFYPSLFLLSTPVNREDTITWPGDRKRTFKTESSRVSVA